MSEVQSSENVSVPVEDYKRLKQWEDVAGAVEFYLDMLESRLDDPDERVPLETIVQRAAEEIIAARKQQETREEWEKMADKLAEALDALGKDVLPLLPPDYTGEVSPSVLDDYAALKTGNASVEDLARAYIKPNASNEEALQAVLDQTDYPFCSYYQMVQELKALNKQLALKA